MKRTLENRASVTLALGLEAALAMSSMTKLVLAREARCSPGHITDIEKRTKNPSQALISRLAAALGMTPADLYDLGEQKLDEQTLEQARRTRQRLERLRTCDVLLDALAELGTGGLQTVVAKASQLLDRRAE
jgi:transcriptional regulator with XRE-family HTH domain